MTWIKLQQKMSLYNILLYIMLTELQVFPGEECRKSLPLTPRSLASPVSVNLLFGKAPAPWVYFNLPLWCVEKITVRRKVKKNEQLHSTQIYNQLSFWI